MRKVILVAASLASLVACTPGAGENQSCNNTPDCQAREICLALGIDGGYVCKFECTQDSDCPSNESCQGSASDTHCDPVGAADGGH